MKTIFFTLALGLSLFAKSADFDPGFPLTTDQKAAASVPGVSVLGNILVCELRNLTSKEVLGQTAANPAFGYLPNSQLTLTTAEGQKAQITMLSAWEHSILVRMDLWSVRENYGADFSHKTLTLTPASFIQQGREFGSVELTTAKTKSGAMTRFELSCHGSEGFGSSDD